MKLCSIVSIILLFSVYHSLGQDHYPVPEPNRYRLFYVQHSNNHNTYVYDANLTGPVFTENNPVDIYRILYEEDGRKTKLTALQQKFAYGLDITKKGENNYDLAFRGSDKLILHLMLDKQHQPKAWLVVNNKQLLLDRIFIKIKKGSSGLKVRADYILFYGKDFTNREPVMEKLIP